MESVRYLKGANSPFDKVIVYHDMTKSERVECKAMVEEAKQLQAAEPQGEWNYRVGGLPGQLKIVKLKKRF